MIDMYTEKEIQELFKNRLEKKLNSEAWIILFDGERYRTYKGKSLWKKKGHASSAFRNDIESKCKRLIEDKLNLRSWQERTDSLEYKYAFENFRDQLISEGRLKFVNLNEQQ